MKLYTDASIDETADIFGIGYVIELRTGATIQGKHFVNGEYTSMDAEWHAIMQGLEIAKENVTSHDDGIKVITDCQPLVEKIREPDDMYDDKWYQYRSRVLEQLFTFEDWDLYWEKRDKSDGNSKADRLAREAMWQGRDSGDGNAREGITFR